MRTSELTGAALDWAVAKCEFPDALSQDLEVWVQPLHCDDETDFKFQPSIDWAQGGPIIERERIGFKYTGAALGFVAWVNGQLSTKHDKYGETPLIAGMRCYVASKLGDDVTLPPELEQTA